MYLRRLNDNQSENVKMNEAILNEVLSNEIKIFEKEDLFYLSDFNRYVSRSIKNNLSSDVSGLIKSGEKFSKKELLSFERMLNLVGGVLIRKNTLQKRDPITIYTFDLIRNYFRIKIDKHVIWKGMPEFMNEKILSEFQKESRKKRKQATQRNDAFVSSPGDVASEIIQSDWIQNKVKQLYPRSSFSGFGTYIYYDYDGSNVRPHVDVGEFLINVLVNVEHLFSSKTPTSSTIIYGKDFKERKCFTVPGEILIFPAGALFHGRAPVSNNEKITIFTSGFKCT
jgi:hypothetical protein